MCQGHHIWIVLISHVINDRRSKEMEIHLFIYFSHYIYVLFLVYIYVVIMTSGVYHMYFRMSKSSSGPQASSTPMGTSTVKELCES